MRRKRSIRNMRSMRSMRSMPSLHRSKEMHELGRNLSAIERRNQQTRTGGTTNTEYDTKEAVVPHKSCRRRERRIVRTGSLYQSAMFRDLENLFTTFVHTMES